jgi:uncharacterized protein YdeI (YjbR/CyaY-like superfamily)
MSDINSVHPTITFKSSSEFRAWLEKNHAESAGIWLKMAKKGAPEATITYAEALDQALCFGWIDGQKKLMDAHYFVQKFTPRRPKSGWSKVNTQHAERLIKSGEMTPAGVEAIEAAKRDGRWQAAYDSPSTATPPEEFLEALNKNKKAKAFYETLNKANVYAILYRIQTAKKAETKANRIQQYIEMLERHEKFHP